MKVLINAVDKAVRAGVYTLEETAAILNEINKTTALLNAEPKCDCNEPKSTVKKAKKDEAGPNK